jgi:hypothetical protein
MAFIGTRRWESLEQWRATAFLVAGGIFVVDAALLAVHMSTGTEPAALGQAFVGASWTAAFVGLLGFYPSLADRSRWLARAGAVFAAIGAITMAAMATTSLGYFTGVLAGELSEVAMFFLPPVFIGIVLGFGLFGVASLRTGIYSRSVGLLFLLLPITFLFNVGTGIAGFNPLAKVLGVVSVLALTMLAIGYLLRTGSALADREGVEASSDVSAG